MSVGGAVLALMGTLLLGGCGDEEATPTPAVENATAAELVHIHGLGVNPADDSLYIATHSGLFRSPEDSEGIERVGTSEQDTMGFTVVGPDRFLGSGHPGPEEGGPSNLGLIESSDAGGTWQEVSLAGEADFHTLRYAHDRVYAYNGLTGELMLSSDGGESWESRTPPRSIIDLAVDPSDEGRILVSTDQGLALSEDDGKSWKPVDGEIGLLAWPEDGALYLADSAGKVSVAKDAGGRWQAAGEIGGQPAALTAASADELYAARGGTVVSSADGGKSWQTRASS